MLDARLAKRRGDFTLDVSFSAESGSTTVLIGESGAGKTSVLRLLAGLDRLDEGWLTLEGARYADATLGVHVPPWQREIGYVAQDYALFPHLSVYDNVAFGLRAAGAARRAVKARVRDALALVGIPELAARMPGQLSGGQQQRAALARALVLDPRLLLLDEPLSSLDLQTRRTLRLELRALLKRLSCVTVYVTHSPVEALVFGDRLIVIDGGQVAQAGSRDDLLRSPRSPFVAELVGTNLFVGRPAGLVRSSAAAHPDAGRGLRGGRREQPGRQLPDGEPARDHPVPRPARRERAEPLRRHGAGDRARATGRRAAPGGARHPATAGGGGDAGGGRRPRRSPKERRCSRPSRRPGCTSTPEVGRYFRTISADTDVALRIGEGEVERAPQHIGGSPPTRQRRTSPAAKMACRGTEPGLSNSGPAGRLSGVHRPFPPRRLP